MREERFLIDGLIKRTGLHRNTIYKLIERGIISPEEIVGRYRIFSNDTVEAIRSHYERLNEPA